MVEKPRQDSSRDLLEELEEGWGTPAAPAVQARAPAAPGTNPDLSEVDEGWLDDLFPGEEDDDTDEEEEDEEEPELPDERLDPEAFALAKKAREERAARKKERKRAKVEAKKARQKARLAAQRQKQKAKKNRPPPSTRSAPVSKRDARRAAARERPVSDPEATPSQEDEAEDLIAAGLPAPKPRRAGGQAARRPSTMASIKLLAIVLAVLVAIGAVVAVILK